MISIEHFRKNELIAMLTITLAWASANALLYNYFYVLIILTFAAASLSMLMTSRFGRATLPIAAGSLIIAALNRTGVIQYEMLLLPTLIAGTGIMDLLAMLIGKCKTNRTSLCFFLPAIIGSASIPWTMLIISGAMKLDFIGLGIADMTLASMFSGIAGMAIAMIIWENIKTRKLALRIMHE